MVKLLTALGTIFVVVGILVGIMSAALAFAWNLVIPVTFDGPELSLPSAFGLLLMVVIPAILLRILITPSDVTRNIKPESIRGDS